MKRRNTIARDLRSPKYRQRIKADAKRKLVRVDRKRKHIYLKGALEDIIWIINKFKDLD